MGIITHLNAKTTTTTKKKNKKKQPTLVIPSNLYTLKFNSFTVLWYSAYNIIVPAPCY